MSWKFPALVFAIFMGIVVLIASQNRASGPGMEQAAVLAPVEDPKIQAARSDMIDKLIAGGVFEKVTQDGTHPHVYVRRVFYEGDFDDKQKLVSVVYGFYYGNGPGHMVMVYDARTNKGVGSFSPETGLILREP